MKRQHLSVESAKFLLGGGLNTALTYAIYYIFHLTLPYQFAYAAAYLSGIVFSYWINATFVFKTPMTWRGLFAYPVVYLVQYLISALLLGTLVEQLDMPKILAPLVVIVVSIPLTFIMTRWILRRP